MSAPTPIAYSRDDIQALTDLRMMALAIVKRCERRPAVSHVRVQSVANRIAGLCETVILEGPLEYRGIVEKTAPLEVIQHELSQSTYDRHKEGGS